jgi:hypothetical protein
MGSSKNEGIPEGVESDSGDAYVQQVYQDERDILLDMLTSLKACEIHQEGSAF